MFLQTISVGSAAGRLTGKILGHNSENLVDILKAIASELNLSHIAHLRFAPNKSLDAVLFAAVSTYSREWQRQYFQKQYHSVDPVVKRGGVAILPFDWEDLPNRDDDPVALSFFVDATRHGVGCNGLSIPVRNQKNTHSLVSFSSDLPRREWDSLKQVNMTCLQELSALIDSAAGISSNLPSSPVELSRREEQCLIWAARGKTCREVAGILGLSTCSVRAYLDTARHKLHCINLTHAVGVALATGLIPATAVKEST